MKHNHSRLVDERDLNVIKCGFSRLQRRWLSRISAGAVRAITDVSRCGRRQRTPGLLRFWNNEHDI
jgi:hypothetical protein